MQNCDLKNPETHLIVEAPESCSSFPTFEFCSKMFSRALLTSKPLLEALTGLSASLRQARDQASLVALRDFSVCTVRPRHRKTRPQAISISRAENLSRSLAEEGAFCSKEHPFPKNARDKAAFLSQRSLALCKLSEGQAATLWKATRHVGGTGSDSKAKLHELATAAKKYLAD